MKKFLKMLLDDIVRLVIIAVFCYVAIYAVAFVLTLPEILASLF